MEKNEEEEEEERCIETTYCIKGYDYMVSNRLVD